MKTKAFTLLEMLVAILIMWILMALVAHPVARAVRHVKAVALGVEAFGNARIEAFVANDNQLLMDRMATNKPFAIYSDDHVRPGGEEGVLVR